MTTVEVFAPAKINLALHVTGRRDDGYHELDSLVAFAEVGDRLTLSKSSETSLRVTGPFANAVPVGSDNLVLKAAAMLGLSAEIVLEKNLPVASGIGGGSADAAAAISGLTDLYNVPLPDTGALVSLGADVPVCLRGGIQRMRGIGERVEIVESAPLTIPMVLVNPLVPVSTPSVFKALERVDRAPMEEPIPETMDDGFVDWLRRQRNDLEQPACGIAPEIATVLSALRASDGAEVVRMSGSGATCFALFHDERLAAAARATIAQAHPNWWVVSGIS